MMHLIDHDGLHYLQFPLLSTLHGVAHGVFTRCSVNGTRLNAGLSCGDPDALVWQNRHRMRAALCMHEMVFARQVHGSTVAVWPGNNRISLGCDTSPRHESVDGDALVTAESGCALFIQVADCQPVMLVDPVRRVLANVHSGWRGSIRNIVGRTIQTMVKAFGCRAENMIGVIGPSLGPCCAEFIHYRREIPENLWHYGLGNDHFDFWRLSVDQMTAEGIPKENTAVAGLCTRCNQHLFFSYRGERNTGRFAAVVGWVPQIHRHLKREDRR